MFRGGGKRADLKATENEISVCKYDHYMRERFAKAFGAISSAKDICDTDPGGIIGIAKMIVETIFEMKIFAKMREQAVAAEVELSEIAQQYDLVAVNFVVGGGDGAVARKQYFAMLSCKNFSSRLCDACLAIGESTKQIAEFTNIIETFSAGNTREIREFLGGGGAAARGTSHAHVMRSGFVMRASASARQAHARDVARARTSATTAAQQTSERAVPAAKETLAQRITRATHGINVHEVFAPLKSGIYSICEAITRAVDISLPIRHRACEVLSCDSCGFRMRVLQDMSEAVCDKCGRVDLISDEHIAQDRNASIARDDGDELQQAMAGAAPSEKMQAIIAETYASAKLRGGYNYTRHLKLWLERLQAIESYEFRKEDIESVKKSIESDFISADKVNWRALTCREVARHLCLRGLSSLREHIPKLLKELGGCAPPILDYDAEQIVLRDFKRIMEIYSQLVVEPGNKPYYPFFIGKIIKRRFKGKAEYHLVDFISRQGHETVNKNDRIYKRICEAAPRSYDLVYEPETD